MKVGDLVTHWVSKRIGVIVSIKKDLVGYAFYKVKWFDGEHGTYDKMRLDRDIRIQEFSEHIDEEIGQSEEELMKKLNAMMREIKSLKKDINSLKEES